MKIHPVRNNVLIQRKEKKEMSEGGIILPGQKQKEQMLGTIITIGSQVDVFEENDKVIFPDFTGVLVGKNYVIMEQKDIVAKYED